MGYEIASKMKPRKSLEEWYFCYYGKILYARISDALQIHSVKIAPTTSTLLQHQHKKL